MKVSKQTKSFLIKNGDKDIRKLINKGGRAGALKDFNSLLLKAVKPLTSSR